MYIKMFVNRQLTKQIDRGIKKEEINWLMKRETDCQVDGRYKKKSVEVRKTR